MWVDIRDRKPQDNAPVFVKTHPDAFNQMCHYDANLDSFIYWSESKLRYKTKKKVIAWYEGLPRVSYELPKKFIQQ
jgi:hypothetical protein